MKYRVVLRPIAERDLIEAADWIAERAPQGAARWFNGFLERLQALEDNPESYALAQEAAYLSIPLRELLYRTKSSVSRALFVIVDDEVRVLRIRRPGQDLLQREDFP
jgi:plasmid stabilization system protein ParE